MHADCCSVIIVCGAAVAVVAAAADDDDELLHVYLESYVCSEILHIYVQVLLHGCILSEQNIDTVLSGIQRDLEKIETSLADSMLDVIPGHRDVSADDFQPVEKSRTPWKYFMDVVACFVIFMFLYTDTFCSS